MSFQKTARNLLGAAAIASALIAAPVAMAHGAPDPQHGGVVQAAADLAFELVGTADGAVIYVTDHGDDYDVARLSGTITVLDGSAKSEAPLKPAGGNKLEAPGLRLAQGAKAVAVLNGGGKPITVRFAVK